MRRCFALFTLALASSYALAQHDTPSLSQAVQQHAAGEQAAAYAAFKAVLDEALHAFGHGDYASAEELLREWLEHFPKLAGEDPANLVLPRSYLARCVAELDGPAAARAMADELFAGIDFDHHDHTDLRAVISLNTGLVLLANGDLPRAERCLEDATHTVQEMAHSPTQLHMWALGGLRTLRVRQGHIDEAREITGVRLAQLRQRGDEHPELAQAFSLFDEAHRLRETSNADFREVAGRMAAAVELWSPWLGADDPFLLSVQVEQAQALVVDHSSLNTARHLLEDAIERLAAEPLLNRHELARAKDVLGFVLMEQSEPARALAMMEEAVVLEEADSGRGSSSYETRRRNLCQLVQRMGTRHELCP